MMQIPLLDLGLYLLFAGATGAAAQEKGMLTPRPLPPLVYSSNAKTPAKELFARKLASTKGEPHALGFYSAGCLAGGKALPITGPTWQVMRPSRNRNWGHPNLIRFLENLSVEVHRTVSWNGLLIGDMSQPRGGPMINGHLSHQVGLDADVWLRPMPDRELTRAEREEMSTIDVVAQDRLDVDWSKWTSRHGALIEAAAVDPQVERIFVNAAIKKELCRSQAGDRTWLSKVRPFWGHDHHFHVRLRCPAESTECKPQQPPVSSDGCDDELDWWFTEEALHPKVPPEPEKPRSPLTLADLPAACRAVLAAP